MEKEQEPRYLGDMNIAASQSHKRELRQKLKCKKNEGRSRRFG